MSARLFATLPVLIAVSWNWPAEVMVAMNSPWHTCMHGLDLGGRPMRFDDPADATSLLRLSRGYVTRASSRPYARWVEVLVCVAMAPPITSREQGRVWTSLRGIWHALNWPVARSMGCALAINVLSRTSMWPEHAEWLDVLVDACIREALDAMVRADSERERYILAMGAVALLHAVTRAGKRQLLGRHDDGRELVSVLAREVAALQEPFLRGRCLGVLLASVDDAALAPETISLLRESTTREMRVLDSLLARPHPGLHDGVHAGQDHILFPLALLLSGASKRSVLLIEPEALTSGKSLMRLLFGAASLQSKASQWRFCSAVLMRMGDMGRQQALDATLNLARRYVDAGCAEQADAYLRCCYLLTTAEGLDGRALLPKELERPLRAMPDLLSTGGEHLDPKYRRQTMWSAYALFASGSSSLSMGLSQTCERLKQAWASGSEPWDESGCMELGHALVDAALDLSPHINTNQEVEAA